MTSSTHTVAAEVRAPKMRSEGAPPRSVRRGPRSSVARFVRRFYRRIRESYELHQYTPHTIAEYFRKQGAQIGEGCYIVPTTLGTEPYLVRIGNHVAIAAQVAFITHDGASWVFRDEVPDLQVFGPIVIGDNCCIGLGAILCPNVHIGANSIVAAGSVVLTDVPPNTIVAGVPARPWGSREKYRENCLARWSIQRPPDAIIDPRETWWNSRHFEDNSARLKRHLLAIFQDDLG